MMNYYNEKIEVLKTAFEYIGKLIDGIHTAVTKYQGGYESEGTKWTVQIADGLNWLIEALTLTADAQIEKIDISLLNPYLLEVNEALENTDYVLLADLLNYEILPILEEWETKLSLTLGE
jgi:hypothetical protein